MILKRHRDIMFIDHCDDKPIFIILTTLSAHSYEGEEKLSDALFAILSTMDQFIERRADGSYVIANPSDPLENFADKWKDHPERALAFESWLAQARSDFARIAALSNKQLIAEYLETGVSRNIADRVRERSITGACDTGHLTTLIIDPASSKLEFAWITQSGSEIKVEFVEPVVISSPQRLQGYFDAIG